MNCPEECPYLSLLNECTSPIETCAFKETEDFLDPEEEKWETVQEFEDACHYCDGQCGPCQYKF